MRRSWSLVVVLAALALPVGAQAGNGHGNPHAVCGSPRAGHAHCHALVVTDAGGTPFASTSPTGLAPATIQSVYGFPTALTAGAGTTIAIVDAYDDPTAENDLSVFSSQYGLPACTTANGCFSKVNETGGTSYPASDSNWALEISLDIEWAHAIAPGAKILLVEASSNSFADLLAGEDYARQHAQYVSNSWGGSEFSGESSYDYHFVQSGVSFFVSAGDSGLPAEYPSASPDVISVGGTTLNFDSSGNFQSETGWASGGGGCSAYESATAAQSGFSQYGQVGCGGKRSTPDVALDADPNSGVSVYDSTPYSGQSGWFTVGGTSASSPMWAAASADAGVVVDSPYVYGSAITYRDITSGNNGAACLVGYDLCSGRGSWLWASAPPPPPPSQATLAFAGPAQTLTAGQASSAMQVSVSAAQTSVASVTLTSSSAKGTFSTSAAGPWASTLTLTIPAGSTTTPAFYYEDTAAGSPTLTAAGTGLTSGTQTETVVAGALASISVSPSSATVAAGAGQTFTASGVDQYGNAVSVATATWTTTAPGTLSSATGSSTVFTGTSAGSGSVTAGIGGVSGSASVTVTSLGSMTVKVVAGSLSRTSRTYHVPLTVTAVDSSTSAPLAGASVTLNVYAGSTCTGTAAASGTGTTGSNGQVVFTFSTRQAATWCALATVSTTGYGAGRGTTTFAT